MFPLKFIESIETILKALSSRLPFLYDIGKLTTAPLTTKLLQGAVSTSKQQNSLVAEFPGFVKVVVFKPSEMERYLKEEEEAARKAAEAEARGGADEGATNVEAEAEARRGADEGATNVEVEAEARGGADEGATNVEAEAEP